MKSERLGNVRKVADREEEAETCDANKKGGLKFGDVAWVKIRNSLWWPAQVVDESMVNVHNKPKKKMKGEILFRLYGSYKYLYFDPAMYCSEFKKILKENNGSYKEIFQKSLEKDISNMKSRKLKRGDSETREKPRVESPPKSKKAKLDGTRNTPTHTESRKLPDPLSGNSKNKKANASVNRKNKQDDVKKKNKRDQRTSVGGPQATPRSKARAESLNAKSPKTNAVPGRTNSNGPTVLVEAVVKSPGSGMRRIKVMQSLGLVAPSGSPFLLSN